MFYYNDLSFANLKNALSQGGYTEYLHKDEKTQPRKPKKMQRFVKNTLAAETLAVALEILDIYCTIIVILLKDIVKKLSIHCFTDNKSLLDSVSSTKTLQDKKLNVDIYVTREMLKKNLHNLVCEWKTIARLALQK